MIVTEKVLHKLQTLVVHVDGSFETKVGPDNFWQGVGDLLAVNAPAIEVKLLAPQDTTRVGFVKVGHALQYAMNGWQGGSVRR